MCRSSQSMWIDLIEVCSVVWREPHLSIGITVQLEFFHLARRALKPRVCPHNKAKSLFINLLKLFLCQLIVLIYETGLMVPLIPLWCFAVE